MYPPLFHYGVLGRWTERIKSLESAPEIGENALYKCNNE